MQTVGNSQIQMTTQEKIDRFCDYFSGQIEAVSQLSIQGSDELDWSQNQVRFYRKVILVNYVDTLAGIRFSRQKYPQFTRQNQYRFKRFLEEGGCWDDGAYVSLPFLEESIRRGKIGAGRLKDFISNQLENAATQDGGSINFREIDVLAKDLLAMTSTEQEEKEVEYNQHYSLLYRYRNHLVHESREPGGAMDVSGDGDEPFYHGYLNEEGLFLAYPEDLFKAILAKAIAYTRSYLEKHEFDPWSFVGETSKW